MNHHGLAYHQFTGYSIADSSIQWAKDDVDLMWVIIGTKYAIRDMIYLLLLSTFILFCWQFIT